MPLASEQLYKLSNRIFAAMPNHMSFRELARAAGLSQSAVILIVNAERTPTLETVDRIAAALGVGRHDLIAPEWEVAMAQRGRGSAGVATRSEVADLCRRIRLGTGLSRAQFAMKAGLNVSTYKGYESGRFMPGASALEAIRKAGFP